MKVFERFLTKTDSKINPKIESMWSSEDYTDVLTHFRKEPPGPEAFLVVSVSSVQETCFHLLGKNSEPPSLPPAPRVSPVTPASEGKQVERDPEGEIAVPLVSCARLKPTHTHPTHRVHPVISRWLC